MNKMGQNSGNTQISRTRCVFEKIFQTKVASLWKDASNGRSTLDGVTQGRWKVNCNLCNENSYFLSHIFIVYVESFLEYKTRFHRRVTTLEQKFRYFSSNISRKLYTRDCWVKITRYEYSALRNMYRNEKYLTCAAFSIQLVSRSQFYITFILTYYFQRWYWYNDAVDNEIQI